MDKQIDKEKRYFCPQCGAILSETKVMKNNEIRICPRCYHDLREEVSMIAFKDGVIKC